MEKFVDDLEDSVFVDSDMKESDESYLNVRCNDSKLPVEKFDLTSMCANPQILIIGENPELKQNLVIDILKAQKQINGGLLFSFKEILKPNITNQIDYLTTYEKLDMIKIRNLLNDQRNDIRNNKDNTNKVIVYENNLTCIDLRNSKMHEVLLNGRHYNITQIVETIDPLVLKPEMRCNLDYIFIFAHDSHSDLKKIYDNYCGMFPTFVSFRNIFKQLAANGGCMVVINRGATKTFLEKVKFYKSNSYSMTSLVDPEKITSSDVNLFVSENDTTTKTKTIEYNNQQVKVKILDLQEIPDISKILAIAKRGSGKSWLVRALLKSRKNTTDGIIVNPTERMDKFYCLDADLANKIRHEFNQAEIENFIKTNDVNKNKFIVLDDALSSRYAAITVDSLLPLCEPFNLFEVISLQYALGISKESRKSFDYVFLAAEDFKSNIQRVFDHYADFLPAFDSFRQIFDQLAKDYGFMVICKNGPYRIMYFKVDSPIAIDKKQNLLENQDLIETTDDIFDYSCKLKKISNCSDASCSETESDTESDDENSYGHTFTGETNDRATIEINHSSALDMEITMKKSGVESSIDITNILNKRIKICLDSTKLTLSIEI